jgi:hypothetical protein
MAQIPEGIKQPSAIWTDSVTGLSSSVIFILATLDQAADSICLDIHRLTGGISEHSSYAAFLMANYSCMRRADFLAGAIPPRPDEVFLRHD